MTYEQQRLEVLGTVTDWVKWFMEQNHVPASLMEDALVKATLSIKDQVVQEFIQAASAETAAQEKAKTKEDEANGN